MLQFLATAPLVGSFNYDCGGHGQYHAVLICELVKHVLRKVVN